jgi:predicted nuclease of predicted toxin-antitoxin system
MLRLASDQDVNDRIIRGLFRRVPDLDLVRVREVGLSQTPDPEILEWSAKEERVLITEDVNTMVGFAWARVKAAQPMHGVLALREGVSIGRAIEDILLVAECYTAEEMKALAVVYIPL